MNSPVWMLSALRSRSSAPVTLPIIETSQKQRYIYSELIENKQWRKLAELCALDIQKANGYLHILTGSINEVSSTRKDTLALIESLKKAIILAQSVEEKAVNEDLELKQTLEIIERGVLPRDQGRLLLGTAAHQLLLYKSAALQNFARAEINCGFELINRSCHASAVSAAFWDDPNIDDLLAIVDRHIYSLDKLQGQVYASALGDKKGLSGELNNLIQWVSQNIRNLLYIQSTIQVLLASKKPDSDALITTRLVSLSIDVGVLIDDMIASDLASFVSTLSINRLSLSPNIQHVLLKTGSLPFRGRIHVGKKTDIRRLSRLPDNLLVKVEGIITSVKYVKEDDRHLFIGKLKDITGDDSITLITPVNLAAHGMRIGSYARLTALYKKTGTIAYNGEHLEIESIKIKEIYSHDIWKVAFFDLATPYFNAWPGYFHINFVSPPEEPGDAAGHGSTRGFHGPCDNLYQAYLHAAQALDQAEGAVTTAVIACSGAAVAVAGMCFGVVVTWGASFFACTAAITAYGVAMSNLNIARMKENAAEQDLAKAHQDWLDCLQPINPATGYNSGATTPDWVADWDNDPIDPPGGPDSTGPDSTSSISIPPPPPPPPSIYV